MSDAKRALEQGEGVLRLAPTWVPRSFNIPGRRIKLHPSDYYAFGAVRGGITERWFSSTTKADNGPLTEPDEGLSYLVYDEAGDSASRMLFADAVADLGAELLGDAQWDEFGGWPMYSKFFDNKGALPHHLHQMEEHAAAVGQKPKPEAYYFAPQMNNYGANYPYTFFGLEPGTTKDEVRACLEAWDQGDNGIRYLSKAYRLELGTGWYVPSGLLHAPGSLCTYEPQWASDVFSMFQSLVNEEVIGWDMLVKDVPDNKKQDLDYIISMVDWEANINPNIKAAYYRPPLPVRPMQEMESDGYIEKWITYGNEYLAAKEMTVMPGATVTIRDAGAYGFITVQGHGTLGRWSIETPSLIRFGQLSNDEFFVSHAAAQEGVTITNPSSTDPIVMLKHFGPNPDAPAAP